MRLAGDPNSLERFVGRVFDLQTSRWALDVTGLSNERRPRLARAGTSGCRTVRCRNLATQYHFNICRHHRTRRCSERVVHPAYMESPGVPCRASRQDRSGAFESRASKRRPVNSRTGCGAWFSCAAQIRMSAEPHSAGPKAQPPHYAAPLL